MDTSLNISLKTQQNLSPQMLQALALLPMPILELRTHIQQQIESNPALEIPESDFSSPQQDFEDDYEYENSDYDPQASERKQKALENTSISGESLTDHLMKQLGEVNLSDDEYKIGELLIGNLNDNGFYIMDLDSLFDGKNFAKEDIDKVTDIVRTFDPSGICVPDYKSSLILQAKLSGMQKEDLEIFRNLVENCLDDVKNNKLGLVASKLKIQPDDAVTFISILKAFTPFPGSLYSNADTSYIEPEFSVKTIDGNLVLEMNDDALPDITISQEFVDLSKNLQGPDAKETANYISDCVKQAKTLINQLDLRKKTMAKTAAVILEKQHDFFVDGPQALKTMTLKEVADEVGVHETTISRLSQSKWIDTDFGLFQMKFFFSQGVASSDGEETVSRNAVKDIIAKIIEEKGNISDQKISDALLEKGIKCARRTVSKYRAELNINSSFSR